MLYKGAVRNYKPELSFLSALQNFFVVPLTNCVVINKKRDLCIVNILVTQNNQRLVEFNKV